MANPTGELKVTAGGKEYRLHLGMSALAEIQERFGAEFEAILVPSEAGKLPSFRVMHAIILAALQRYHGDAADRWLADDIMAENQDALADLLVAAFPNPEAGDGGGKTPAAA